MIFCSYSSVIFTTLEAALKAKHHETFWIKARSAPRSGVEYFDLLSAIHTRNPVDGQFERLLDSGSITVDHEVCGGLTFGAHERGPAFKAERQRIGELFRGIPREYELQ